MRAHADDLATILVGTRSPAHLRRSVELMEAPPLPDAVLDAVGEVIDDGSAWRERRD